jgi:beta-lactamase class A
VRSNGDSVTRLDRTEPSLNENRPGDVRDTTSPLAMAQLARRLLSGETAVGGVEMGAPLSDLSRLKLQLWMQQSTTGLERLRKDLPWNWTGADKTGTGDRGAVNDVAIFYPPAGRKAVYLASYMSGGTATAEVLNAAHAEIGRIIVETWS